MTGIFGFFARADARAAGEPVNAMAGSMAASGYADCLVQVDGCVGLGVAYACGRLRETPAPLDPRGGFLFAVTGRVDNRKELRDALTASGPELSSVDGAAGPSDEILLQSAYLRWGESCPERIHGDWAMAVWQSRRQRLFLARDRCGTTALYYYADARVFAFASSRQALLALPPGPVRMDELYLAQVLVSWSAYHGDRTIHAPIRRLPPAHALAVTPDNLSVRQYWRLEDVPELRLRRRTDYVAAFREIFDGAVSARLGPNGPVGVSLSGGLDSGSVAATAARWLDGRGRRLEAFTSVPVGDTHPFTGSKLGDEYPLAAATAKRAGIIAHHAVPATSCSPIEAIRRMLEIHDEPLHAAGNAYWLLGVQQAAQERGCGILLVGQGGNGTISWTGDVFSQSLAFRLRRLGMSGTLRRSVERMKEGIRAVIPTDLFLAWRHRRIGSSWPRSSAIHPEFARRLNLLDRLSSAPDSPMAQSPRDARARRLLIVKPGRSLMGALQAQRGVACGLEIRDPTSDARVVEFTFSIPDHIFMDPETGVDRWLIRAAMQGSLPDEVRLNRRAGLQAADLVLRLRASAGEVEATLDELAVGPSAEYVDVRHMREVWNLVQTQESPEVHRKAFSILARGIMAGLWVKRFCSN